MSKTTPHRDPDDGLDSLLRYELRWEAPPELTARLLLLIPAAAPLAIDRPKSWYSALVAVLTAVALGLSLAVAWQQGSTATGTTSSTDIAISKAKFSGSFPFSTRYAGELTFGKDGKPAPVPGLADIPGVVTFAGGLPILVGGVQVGGIGVSGGSPDEDEQCAAAALDAVKDALK